jgi:hypothetical protein
MTERNPVYVFLWKQHKERLDFYKNQFSNLVMINDCSHFQPEYCSGECVDIKNAVMELLELIKLETVNVKNMEVKYNN